MHTGILRLALLTLLVAAVGCRREDIRTVTLDLPGLTETNRAKVVEALVRYNGVRHDSYVFDFAKKTLTLRYDSMQVAQTNLRMAIEEKGVKVVFPEQTNGRAGH